MAERCASDGKTLINVANNPNVRRYLVVGRRRRGAAAQRLPHLADDFHRTIQEEGGSALKCQAGDFAGATMRSNSMQNRSEAPVVKAAAGDGDAAGQEEMRHRGWRLTLPAGSPRIATVRCGGLNSFKRRNLVAPGM